MNTIIQPEFRTPQQIEADERLANGDWSECMPRAEIMTKEAALAILSARKKAPSSNGTVDSVRGLLHGLKELPFIWKGRPFRILRAVYDHGRADVEVAPSDFEFEAELKKRIEADRLHALTFFQGYGFTCFPEDFSRYQA
jgi:hypothetical protein